MNILVVDDDVDVLNLMRDILVLKFPSIQVETSVEGTKALRLADLRPPNIVFITSKMAEYGKTIKAKFPSTKVALTVAYCDNTSGFDAVFFKPIDFDALFNFIMKNMGVEPKTPTEIVNARSEALRKEREEESKRAEMEREYTARVETLEKEREENKRAMEREEEEELRKDMTFLRALRKHAEKKKGNSM